MRGLIRLLLIAAAVCGAARVPIASAQPEETVDQATKDAQAELEARREARRLRREAREAEKAQEAEPVVIAEEESKPKKGRTVTKAFYLLYVPEGLVESGEKHPLVIALSP